MTKYIIVTGGVVSGIGKGTLVAAISNLIKNMGFSVSPIKFDGLLNRSFYETVGYHKKQEITFSGEEIFVLEDGTEADSDLGVYERFLDQNLRKENNILNGECFHELINTNRKVGELIKIKPHLMRIYKEKIEKATNNADVAIIEVGGTIGDDENNLFLEFLGIERSKNPADFISVNISYVPKKLGEKDLKEVTKDVIGGANLIKPVKKSIDELSKFSLFPDFVFLRGVNVNKFEVERIAEAVGLECERFYLIPELENIYLLPKVIENLFFYKELCKRLNKQSMGKDENISKYLNNMEISKNKLNIFILGDTESWDSYASLSESLKHASTELGCLPNIMWKKDNLAEVSLDNFDCILIVEGLENIGGKIQVLKEAMGKRIPVLALSAGSQIILAYLEGFSDEEEIYKMLSFGGGPFIKAEMVLGAKKSEIDKNSELFKFVKLEILNERHRHDIEIDSKKIKKVFVSSIREGKFVDSFESFKEDHFIIGLQSHPEYSSRPGKPNKVILNFLKMCMS